MRLYHTVAEADIADREVAVVAIYENVVVLFVSLARLIVYAL